MPDTQTPPLGTPPKESDHKDAWNVAHFRADLSHSNLALAYIELRELCSRVESHLPVIGGEAKRIREIIHCNDL